MHQGGYLLDDVLQSDEGHARACLDVVRPVGTPVFAHKEIELFERWVRERSVQILVVQWSMVLRETVAGEVPDELLSAIRPIAYCLVYVRQDCQVLSPS